MEKVEAARTRKRIGYDELVEGMEVNGVGGGFACMAVVVKVERPDTTPRSGIALLRVTRSKTMPDAELLSEWVENDANGNSKWTMNDKKGCLMKPIQKGEDARMQFASTKPDTPTVHAVDTIVSQTPVSTKHKSNRRRSNTPLYKILTERNIMNQELTAMSGVSVSYLSNIINGKCIPNTDTVNRICFALKVPVSKLFPGFKTNQLQPAQHMASIPAVPTISAPKIHSTQDSSVISNNRVTIVQPSLEQRMAERRKELLAELKFIDQFQQ